MLRVLSVIEQAEVRKELFAKTEETNKSNKNQTFVA